MKSLSFFGLFLLLGSRVIACCAVSPAGSHVVNADQSVIMIWDGAKQMQHFIRQADFKTDGSNVGFIVPSPSRPQLAESGDAAFSRLKFITAPKVHPGFSIPIGCSAMPQTDTLAYRGVDVIEQKRVAGFDATVLTARSGDQLAAWLKDHGYGNSPDVAAWAAPYLGGNWHFTALKVAEGAQVPKDRNVKAASLRISFQTDRPLFPYREPQSSVAKRALDAPDRLLRIYFIADSRYRGEVDGQGKWSGVAVWSGDITSHRKDLLKDLAMSGDTGPQKWWLTEFEDRWPYATAAGDLYFSKDANQKQLKRKDVYAQVPPSDAVLVAMCVMACVMPLRNRWKKSRWRN